MNKSEIPTDGDYGAKKGIPAGRPGAENDMAQAALMLATNQYMYGQVRVFVCASWHVPFSESFYASHRLLLSMAGTSWFMDKLVEISNVHTYCTILHVCVDRENLPESR